MRAAEKLFYLAVFSLLGTSHATSKPPTKSNNSQPNVCAFEPGAIVSDACASYSTLDDLNDRLYPYVKSITQNTDFFSYYRLNLYNKKCPFWSEENGMCGNIACAVNTLDNEGDIPLVWRAQELGKLEGPKAQHPGREAQKKRPKRPLQGELGEDVGESCVVEYDDDCDDRDYCVPDDENATGKGDYVSLIDNPERFTGYAGAGSHQVWEAIYRENCFSKPRADWESSMNQSPFGGQAQAAQDLRSVLKAQVVQQNIQSAIAHNAEPSRVDTLEFEDECLEKRVFHRVVSGMHASISTHLCYDFLNQTTGQWSPNLECYEQRLHKHPERISNLYFNYALMLRAVGKIRQHIKDYEYCSADPAQDQQTKNLVLSLSAAIPAGPEIFDETVMFRDPSVASLKEDFRNRFRNVSRIMDCVGCDKCRLWGKLQTAGYGTALKVLFEFDEHDSSNDPPLRRTELVALINTLGRVSHSLTAIKDFSRMMEAKELGIPVEQLTQKTLPQEKERDTHDDEEDRRPDFNRRNRRQNLTLTEEFREEWDLVWSTFWWVLKSYAGIPAKVWNIIVYEVMRIWYFWIGYPVPPRGWEIKFPGRNEL
ncbi:endoplasmic oxidoreductin [Patellaria atrata CBS 101060]|uniref:Endoplasmic oxidoreductin n=1 Tax=Patellaria atrata CBS 101060 TaxID=1346257 RepID=A0A9P4S5K6_9PEZI|nr:endoplasmic oxidoreductin [Patellaria atrata CBS 101060]